MSLLRGALFNAYLVLLTLVMGLGTFPLRLAHQHRLALDYAKLWSRAVLWGFEKICGVKIVIEGRENLGQGACVIASQHQSFFDGFIWMVLATDPAYVIKRELTRIPLVGPMLVLSGMIPVDRQGGPQALRDMMARTAAALKDGRQVILFPEGTRTQPGTRAPLQSGIIALARQAGRLPVLPVVTNSGLFWPRSPWRKNPGILKVRIGKPLPQVSGRALLGEIDSAWDRLCAQAGLLRTAQTEIPPETPPLPAPSRVEETETSA
ncbi:lysophospholipid acyltransferase family protein [Oecophyllibacter saccharovorans]|uniref:lysophospholipid acyltransferase family protein n=1 Tax=Oecophyllibacter saccharovorans TaxID=2558360 RepID=UPI001141D769|nr:lysophospholipid acyltransferase family protein [Oecophyllibacter saccharovorans]QDH15916.1 1-acyl-sn-glycerol-3-phosphate acyltransferase [Oecophyllibacter saccharovorans]TPW35348.1 1-acyl-sn-glycerol-3-phosphate acyltransferase [Oecophyllibacter saccharovorans]